MTEFTKFYYVVEKNVNNDGFEDIYESKTIRIYSKELILVSTLEDIEPYDISYNVVREELQNKYPHIINFNIKQL